MSAFGIESEVKIRVADLAVVRASLEASDAVLDMVATHEHNLVFDAADGALKAARQVLRLRRYGEASTLTFKGPKRMEGTVKIRAEHETVVLDHQATKAVLEALGYRVARAYEKTREVWSLGAVQVVLDHTPVGEYVELEGPVADLEPLALRLGLDLNDAVTGSYLELWEDARQADPTLGPDMLFNS